MECVRVCKPQDQRALESDRCAPPQDRCASESASQAPSLPSSRINGAGGTAPHGGHIVVAMPQRRLSQHERRTCVNGDISHTPTTNSEACRSPACSQKASKAVIGSQKASKAVIGSQKVPSAPFRPDHQHMTDDQ
eukprot:1045755-Pyramimonas_sp.AAC.1